MPGTSMTSPALVELWPVRLPVADFGALSLVGVFDEIDISVLCRWLKGECHFVLRLPDPLTSAIGVRQLQICVLLHDAATTMLPQPRSLRGIVQRRPSHRSNYLSVLLPGLACPGLFRTGWFGPPVHISGYLSKYLILHMLNYHPIPREHQIFRNDGSGLRGQKVATPEPLLGTRSTSSDQVTEHTLNCQG